MERSGAAQGLAEALAALGRSHLDALLPSILAQCTNPRASVREGHLTLLKFLPLALPDSFLVSVVFLYTHLCDAQSLHDAV